MPAGSTQTFRLVINQFDGWSVLGRITSQFGSGPESPVPAEGNLILASDLSAVAINVYDPTAAVPSTPIFTANPAPSGVVLSPLQTAGVWTAIVGGGNFEYNFPANVFILPSHQYLVVFTFTSAAGGVSHSQCDVHTKRIGVQVPNTATAKFTLKIRKKRPWWISLFLWLFGFN